MNWTDLLCEGGERQTLFSFTPHATSVLDSISGAPFSSFSLLFLFFPFLTVLPHSLLSRSPETDAVLGSSAFHPRCFAPSFGCNMKGRLHKLTADSSCPQEVCPIPGFRIILSWWTNDAITILFFPTFWPAFPMLEQSYGYKMGMCQAFQEPHACSSVC